MSANSFAAVASSAGEVAQIVTESLHGRMELDRLVPELEELDESLDVPLTASVRWAQAAFAAAPEPEPWVLVARGADGQIAAALILSLRDRLDGVVIAPPRLGTDDCFCFRARSPAAGRAVVGRLAAELARSDSSWVARLTGLAPRDPVTHLLATRLPGATVQLAPSVPALRFDPLAGDAESCLRRDVRRSLRRSDRRLSADGVQLRVEVERRPRNILRMLSGLETMHRSRDHDAGRGSDLDDQSRLAFWRAAIRSQAVRGAAQVYTLLLDGRLAAYMVAFPDPPAFRVFDGRFQTHFARYAPGHLLEAEVLARVFRNPSFTLVDWITSVTPEKLIAANTTQPRLTVTASGERTHRSAYPASLTARSAASKPSFE